MTMAAPSGVVTFLFTDVEGSTRRWEADAEGMRAALAAHDDVLRSAIESHGGFVFKHTGDGVCAAFSSPKAAVDAAIAAQRKLERTNDNLARLRDIAAEHAHLLFHLGQPRRWWLLIAMSILVTILVYVIFGVLLGVYFPRGFLGI